MPADVSTFPCHVDQLLEDLNPEQRRAATHTGSPLLILAGAGTGKTRTLVTRVAWLIEQGVDPGRILLLTFTRRAAREMLRRVGYVCGPRRARRILGGTFHAMAHHLLRSYAPRAGLGPSFTVLDKSDAEDLLDLCREDLGLRGGSGKAGRRRFPRKQTLGAIYSRCISSGQGLHDVLAEQFPWVAEHEEAIKSVFSAYEERKQAQDVLDFGDLLAYWDALLQDPVLGAEIAARFDHVLVDEYQDTNRVQRSILLGLRRTDTRVSVVGDDAQAIYGFRGATVQNILGFPEDFPGAEVVRLEQNYRSTEPLLALSNAVMAAAEEGFSKTLWSGRPSNLLPRLVRVFDEDEQNAWVVEDVLARVEEGIPLKQQAILFRTAHHSDLLEVELNRRNIPYHKFGGLRFTDAAHVKDLLAFLRVVENPQDQTSWFRVLKLLDGVGPRTAAAVLAHLAERDHSLEAIPDCPVPPSARKSVKGLGQLLRALSTGSCEAVSEQVQQVAGFYEPILERRYERYESRRADLETLAHVASTCADRAAFLTELALDPPSNSGEMAGPPHLDDDWLVLSTIHSAKGLEWEAVTVLRGSDGMIPSDLATGSKREIEEERRLLYVALTRAKRYLSVVFPQRYHPTDFRKQRPDRHLYSKLSRFLTADAQRQMELVVREANRPRANTTPGKGALVDLRRTARKRWE